MIEEIGFPADEALEGSVRLEIPIRRQLIGIVFSFQSCSRSFHGKIYGRSTSASTIDEVGNTDEYFSKGMTNVSFFIDSRSNTETNSLSTATSTSAVDSGSDRKNDEQISWPSMYSTMEHLSLSEKRKQPKPRLITGSVVTQDPIESRSRPTSSASTRHNTTPCRPQDQDDQPVEYQFHGRGPFLSASKIEDRYSSPSSSTFFGSGSNVGRGRPLTSDR